MKRFLNEMKIQNAAGRICIRPGVFLSGVGMVVLMGSQAAEASVSAASPLLASAAAGWIAWAVLGLALFAAGFLFCRWRELRKADWQTSEKAGLFSWKPVAEGVSEFIQRQRCGLEQQAASKTAEIEMLTADLEACRTELETARGRLDRQAADLAAAQNQLRQLEAQSNRDIEAAREQCRLRSEFLASMSHEIRTPMNAIIGFGDLLADENLSDEQRNYVQIIQCSAKNMLALLNDILDFSKIEAGKLHVEISECRLGELMEDIDSLMRPAASRKQLDFQVLQCQELPQTVMTDPLRLRQCLLNLANNAVKFTESGHIYLNVSLVREDGLQYIRFDVEDTGVGISPEQQESVFDPYIQARGRENQKGGGTGLGLAITRKLMDLLGGRIFVSSRPGRGSVFTLQIPYVPKEEKNPAIYNKYARAQDAAALPAADTLQGHVLVVEDNPANQALISLLLKKMGLTVEIAVDGLEGVEKVSQQTYDLVLMDMQMPRMNGYEATRKLRRDGCTMPVIAVTANAMKGDEKKCLDAGCTAYISKPVEKKILFKMLGTYLGSSPCKVEHPVQEA